MPDAADHDSNAADCLFDDYVRSREAGMTPDFESLCRTYPEHAAALRKHEVARLLLDRLMPGPLAGESADRTTAGRALEVGAGPGISSVDGDLVAGIEPVSELLRRLQEIGPRADRYEVVRQLGRGGMGEVLLVKDKELRRPLAMKVVAARAPSVGTGTPASDSRSTSRFLEEAQITSQLDHPGVVPLHEIGLRVDGSMFFTMRYIEGQDLRTIFSQVRDAANGWSQALALEVILKVCDTMSYAHDKRVIHRDLKPANVMVGQFGEVYVVDWGLGRALGRPDPHDLRICPEVPPPASAVRTERHEERENDPDSPLVTLDGQVIGTPAYMSPEQASGRVEHVGPASDVYAVGAMLYQLISGQVPYVPDGVRLSSRTILSRVIDGPPRPLHEFGRTAPVELVAICDKAMARSIEQRYPDMRALARDLRAYLERRVVAAYRTGSWAETKTWLRRNRALAGLLASLAVGIVLGVVVLESHLESRRRARVRGLIDHLRTLNAAAGSVDLPEQATWWSKARVLVDGLPDARAEIERLRGGTLSQAMIATATEGYERKEELESKQRDLLWRRQMLQQAGWPSVADVQQQVEEHARDLHDQDGVRRTNNKIFDWVRPDGPRQLGFEPIAMPLAERMVAAAVQLGCYLPTYRDTLAFACFRRGDLNGAVKQQEQAVREGTKDASAELLTNLDLLKGFRDSWRDVASQRHVYERLAHEISVMECEREAVAWRRSGRGTAWDDDVARLVGSLIELQYRLTATERSMDATAMSAWQAAIESIRGSPTYESLDIKPQADLLPLSSDPASGLWEFAHLPSGEPARRLNGRLMMEPHTGLVFVLLPGGPLSREDGQSPLAVHKVRLDPFFLSKFEVTEHQWMRMGGDWNERAVLDSWFGARAQGLLSWERCRAWLARVGGGIALPTGAQWEYGCRAGTTTRWWPGAEPGNLIGAAIVAQEGCAFVWQLGLPGAARPNDFGLYDTLGNVAEWCRDGANDKAEARPGDGRGEGLRVSVGARRWLRGGYAATPPLEISCGHRNSDPGQTDRDGDGDADGVGDELRTVGLGGLRPSRPLLR